VHQILSKLVIGKILKIDIFRILVMIIDVFTLTNLFFLGSILLVSFGINKYLSESTG